MVEDTQVELDMAQGLAVPDHGERPVVAPGTRRGRHVERQIELARLLRREREGLERLRVVRRDEPGLRGGCAPVRSRLDAAVGGRRACG